MSVEGIVNFFVAETWFDFVSEGNVDNVRSEVVESYPVRSDEVLTIIAVIGEGEDVEAAKKLKHLTVYVRFSDNRFFYGQNYK